MASVKRCGGGGGGGSSCSIRFLFLFLAIASTEASMLQRVGINYGMMGDDLPPPWEVASMLRSMSVSQTRIYSADPDVLRAFANTGISVMVSIGNEELKNLQGHSSAAKQYAENWVQDKIALFFPATLISGILVGNEVLTGNDTSLMAALLPAIENIYAALKDQDLDLDMFVSTPHSVAILETSYPPSAGTFSPDLVQYLRPLLQFLKRTGAPFMINAYPYFAYKSDPSGISLPYALSAAATADDTGGTSLTGRLDAGIVSDPGSGLAYNSMLVAQVDAVYAAIAAAGFEPDAVEVVVSETGWPSAGDPDEVGANLENARDYNANLVARLTQEGGGTPARPSIPLTVFIFAMFNENQKPGPASERHYGLFYPNGSRVYDVGLHKVPYSSTLASDYSSAAAGATLLDLLLLSMVAIAVLLVVS